MDHSENGFPILYFPSDKRDIPPTSILISNNLDLAYFKNHESCDISKMSDEKHAIYVETQKEHIEIGVKECLGEILDIVTERMEIYEKTRNAGALIDSMMLEDYHYKQAKLQQDTIISCTHFSRHGTVRYCENCSFDKESIERRNGIMVNDNLWFHYHENWGCSKLSCLSCLLLEDKKKDLEEQESIEDEVAVCETCGLCELMDDIDGDTLKGTFTRCETNSSTRPLVWLCMQCCDNESVHESVHESVYEGEFENEDLPEDNSEKMKKIKDIVKEAGDLVYDIQEKISEGEYLKLMDSLQKITNEANS